MRNSRRAGKPEKQGLTGLFTKGKNIPTTAQQKMCIRDRKTVLLLEVQPLQGAVVFLDDTRHQIGRAHV